MESEQLARKGHQLAEEAKALRVSAEPLMASLKQAHVKQTRNLMSKILSHQLSPVLAMGSPNRRTCIMHWKAPTCPILT
jgi:hypothetical protein